MKKIYFFPTSYNSKKLSFFLLFVLFSVMFGDDVYLRNGQVIKNCLVVEKKENWVMIIASDKDRSIPAYSIDSIVTMPFDSLMPTVVFGPGSRVTELALKKNGSAPAKTFDNNSIMIENNQPVISLVTIGDQHYDGNIVYVSDSNLVFWPTGRIYDPNTLATYGKVLFAREIQQIVIKRESKLLSGFGTGALVGGGIGALIGLMSGDDHGGFFALSAGEKALLLGGTLGVIGGVIGTVGGGIQGIDDQYQISGDNTLFKNIIPKLREISIESFSITPAVSELIRERMRKDSVGNPDAAQLSEKSNAPPSRKIVHLTFGAAVVFNEAGSDMSEAFTHSGFGGTSDGWFGSTSYPVESNNYIAWNIAAEYSVSDRFRIGAQWITIPTSDVSGSSSEEESVSGKNVDLFFNYLLLPVDGMLVTRSEIAIGAGASYQWLTVDGNISSWHVNPTAGEYHARGGTAGESFGYNLRLSYDYYISPSFSLQGRCIGRYSGKISVPALSIIDQYDKKLKTLQPHQIGISGVDLFFGMQFHL